MTNLINHLCNCEFCTQKSVCLVCGTNQNLHRAHIIPRYLVKGLIENSSEKEELLSFEGRNVFILCGKHHREFDAFKLWDNEKDKISSFVLKAIENFVGFVTDKTMKQKDLQRLNRWANKNNNFFFGGGEVISFTYDESN